jgi:dipeptidyl aminopeptidase/acylaminoacyl peptidase
LDYKDLGGGDFKDIMAGVDYLIDQGIADTRVSVIQSMQLYSALKGRGIPTRFVYYIGQEHGMTDPIATLDAMKEKLKWFKAYGTKNESNN